jgi:hypothetical protein
MINIQQTTRNLVLERQKQRTKTRLNILNIEENVRFYHPEYFEKNGYQLFYEEIKRLVSEGVLTPLKGKRTNGRNKPLPLTYWLQPLTHKESWDKLEMLRHLDLLDLSFYTRHPEWQTEAEWIRVKAVYAFLKTKHKRMTVSVEERSLELFGNEKYLTDAKRHPEGKGQLNRLHLTYSDIKAIKRGEPFTSYTKPGVTLSEIKTILIVENLPFYHVCVHKMNRKTLVYNPDLLILGEGKKIENSLSFFEDIYPPASYTFYYAGDMDPEGYSIYVRLANRYPTYLIKPATQIYEKMIDYLHYTNTFLQQNKRISDRDHFIEQLQSDHVSQVIHSLWKQDLRVPQEVLTIESLEDEVCSNH